MKYFVIAGDPSGDLHSANFLKELLKLDTQAEINFVGGPKMEAVLHKKPLIPIERTAFIGFVDVVKNLKYILENFSIVKKHLLENDYDVIILVDYPGFNLKIAKWCKAHQLKVYYYISPTVWAWKEDRVHLIMKNVEKLFTIIPFETEFYKKYHYDVEFVGHPLLDVIHENTIKISRDAFLQKYQIPTQKKLIAVLPGSRVQELHAILPSMMSIKKDFKNCHFLIAGLSRLPQHIYNKYVDENVTIIYDDVYSILHFADAGIIKSGTSTMEAALFGLPQVVCYKGGHISYWIARMLVKNIKYISMVNLIMQKEVVKELIQYDFNSKNLKKELEKIISDEKYIKRIKQDYQMMKEKLGGAGASKRLAEKIFYSLKKQN